MSFNQLIRASHWAYKKERDQIREELIQMRDDIGSGFSSDDARRTVQVTVVKGSRSRVRDDGPNRDGRAKAVYDGLVDAGFLVDDSEEWLDHLPVLEEKDGEYGPYLVIEIWDS